MLTVILIWQFGESRKDRHINCMPLSSHLYSKHGFLSNSTEIRHFKIPTNSIIWANPLLANNSTYTTIQVYAKLPILFVLIF